MLAQQRSIGTEKQNRAVQRAAAAFDYADHQPHRVVPRDRAQLVGRGARNLYCALKIPPEHAPALDGPGPDAGAEVESLGITRHKRLGEDNQLCALRGRIGRQQADLGERGGKIEDYWSGLHDGRANGCIGHAEIIPNHRSRCTSISGMRVLLAIALCAMSVRAASMTTEDRQHLVAHLEMTENWLCVRVAGLSEAQLKFRPAPGKWTILDVVEHLTLSEPGYWDDLKASMKGPPGKPKSRDAGDLYVMWYGIDRTKRQTTSKEEEPKGTLTDAGEGMQKVHRLRAEMLQYARTTDEDLRGHMYGYHDVYQWFIMISTHMQRHVMQIREIKASAQYPRS